MQFIYTFSIRLYVVLLWIAKHFNPKAEKWYNGRKYTNYPSIDPKIKVVWFHCASLGEFDQGLPLMEELKQKDPTLFLLVTFFSPSGLEHYTKRKNSVDFACYLPVDTKYPINLFLKHFKPKEAYFIKYEFWSNIILEAQRQGVKLYSVCTLLRKNQRFFKWYGSYFRKTLHAFSHFFVQNQETKKLLNQIGIQNVEIVGDLRFDRVINNKKNVVPDEKLSRFTSNNKVWVLGSSWSVDEDFLTNEINLFKGKIILAPHDISENHLKEIEGRFLNETIRYSSYKDEQLKIIILDCIGKLANAYSYGNFAYVGGGFTGKLHNTLEPAVFGLPILFGPKYKRYPEAQLFLDAHVAFSIKTPEELKKSLHEIESNYEAIQYNIQKIILENKGAALKISNYLKENSLIQK